MAVAKINLSTRLQSTGNIAAPKHEFTMSGLNRCPAGPLYLSNNSASLKSLGLSNVYGVWLHHISCASTATNELFIFASGQDPETNGPASTCLKVREGESVYFTPTCATQQYNLWCSTNGISLEFAVFGV